MKKGGEKKKGNDSTLSFYICYFGAFRRKEVHLEGRDIFGSNVFKISCKTSRGISTHFADDVWSSCVVDPEESAYAGFGTFNAGNGQGPKGGSLEPWSPEISAVEPGALSFY